VFHNRKQRLPLDAYRVDGSTWHVTTNVAPENGKPFLNVELGERQLRSFLRGCTMCNAVPYLICLMPDHMHLLIEVRSVGLVDFMRRTKSSSTKLWWKQGGRDALWQESFYDHGIRDLPDFEAIAAYILQNPVEAGLAEAWEVYPLIGGTLTESSEE